MMRDEKNAMEKSKYVFFFYRVKRKIENSF